MEKEQSKVNHSEDEASEQLKGRRQFVAGIASVGAAALVAGTALSNDPGLVKSKILSRIQGQLESGAEEGMKYCKSRHSKFDKGRVVLAAGNDMHSAS